jgi:capsular polysaccharide biosynthesis protein
VRISKNSNTGILNIDVFGNSQAQVVEISNAILEVLKNKSFLFLGKGQDIDIRVLSGPIYEKNPSLASIGLALIGGFLMGVLLASMWFIYSVLWKNEIEMLSRETKYEKLSPEEETERRSQEYWNSRYQNQSNK